ncbi:hypothetical protein ACFFSW_07680 [Saccharothrix longispora]|uniref:Uncharacterized protein n=1 Tax=Saccharothrix longispora TaxID=33920 RepID=A0ABU1PMC6_9PSEU|nr:hypothetical protein [Saccharothrix longispora]MDR6591765.1 hypothetical protein [Saccharothrix longispora]
MGTDEGDVVTRAGEVPTDGTVDDLLSRLRDELPRALPTAFTTSGPSPSAGDDVYEAFLFALVLKAARVEGYTVTFDDGFGRAPAVFRLRRSPGRLTTTDTFTHAVLSLPNSRKDPLEVHTGISVVGASKVAHEADVVVLPSAVAQRSRMLGTDPPSSKTIMVVEGKFYRRNPVSLGTGREFLGLGADLQSTKTIFAATVTSMSVVHLLQGKSKLYEVGVLPGRKAEADLQGRFATELRGYRNKR